MVLRVASHLMFEGRASEAMELYSSVFPEFRVDRIERYAEGGPGAAGTVMRADITFGQHDLVLIDSPVHHAFTFTASMSLFVDFDSEASLGAAFRILSDGGQVFMPIANYGFSRQFGWCSDRFGVSWQLNLP